MSEVKLKEARAAKTPLINKPFKELVGLQKQFFQLEKRLSVLEDKKKFGGERPEMSRPAQEMVETLFSHLSPMDVVGCDLIRAGQTFDGGYVMAPLIGQEKIAYSLGINRDVSWDLEMAEQGVDVYQYDHTIDSLPCSHEKFHFFKKGIAASFETNETMTCLREELRRNGHQDEQNILLKIDIEGDEWKVLSDLNSEEINQFSQVLIEFHSLHKVYKLFWYRIALEALGKLFKTHQAVHVHGNNNSSMRVVGGYAISPVLEVSFLRRDLFRFAPCTRTFPNALDQPNNPSFADHQLGSFQFQRSD